VGVPAALLALRKELGARRRGTVIGTSRWIHAMAKASPVFAGWRHEHVPSALDLEVYRVRPREEARRVVELGDDAWNVLFVADRFAEKRKGFDDRSAAARASRCDSWRWASRWSWIPRSRIGCGS